MRADYVCTHCQIRGCRAIVFGQAAGGWQCPNEAQWRACLVKCALSSVFTVKCVLKFCVQ